jgi:hypothetical protein
MARRLKYIHILQHGFQILAAVQHDVCIAKSSHDLIRATRFSVFDHLKVLLRRLDVLDSHNTRPTSRIAF